MGTFAALYANGKEDMPEEKKKIFAKRIETLFQAGGMMEIEGIKLFGKQIVMIRKAQMRERGMRFNYNYFEDDCWEPAGYSNTDGRVWSNKIGWSYFNRAVVAAYVLEEQYTDVVAITIVNGRSITSWEYTGWINYLFNETYHVKNFDPWKLFETIYYINPREVNDTRWTDFGDKRYAFIGGCEIYAVLNGTENAIEAYRPKAQEKLENLVLTSMEMVIQIIQLYQKHSEIDPESQLSNLMEIIRSYYDESDGTVDLVSLDDEILKHVLTCLGNCDAPAFVVKAIAEIYGKEFWDLWEEIRDIVKRKVTNLFGNEGYYIVPISTMEFFHQSPDDMIPYWEENSDFEFSKELWDWFYTLKSRYDILVNAEYVMESPMQYIVDIMQEANENYYNIYPFIEFWEETIENISDRRYQVLWKIYEELLRDPELKKAGEVIFVPEGPGHEKEGVFYYGEQPKRRLLYTWDIMDRDKRNNKARVTFRRYMALVANKSLRYKVFGF